MPVAYGYDSETKKYTGEMQCQRDPLESEMAGHDIFLMPGNATDVVPPEEKDGFDIIWNGGSWEYKEKKKEEEPKAYEPTELDKAYQNYYEYKGRLSETDYVNDKINDAINTGDEELATTLREKYKEVFTERSKWREEVRKWESEIERLKTETGEGEDNVMS